MNYLNIKIFDILKNDYWKKRVIQSIPKIVNSGHYNSTNYKNLEERLPLYDCFNVVVDLEQDKMLAISGLFNGGIFPPHTARILDRTYYYDWASGLQSAWRPQFRYSSNFLLPFQEKIALEKQYNSIFFSIQMHSSTNILYRYKPGNKYEILPILNNTCPSLENGEINQHSLCWQNIAIKYLTNNHMELRLPSITLKEYNERYSNIKSFRRR